jgi:hypothetical protein
MPRAIGVKGHFYPPKPSKPFLKPPVKEVFTGTPPRSFLLVVGVIDQRLNFSARLTFIFT